MSKASPKTTITQDVVKYVASLSRLSLDEDEVKTFGEQLSNILGYIEQLNEVDTENTPPTSHVLSSMKNVFREDELGESLSNDEALKSAPDKKDGLFRVPRVI